MAEGTDRYTATRLSAELGLDNRKMRDIPDPNTAYGYEDAKVTPPIPSPAAIQRMEEVLTWLQLAPVEYRRLRWFRAEGWSWRKLGRHFGCGSRQVRLRWRDGVVGLWERL